MALLLGLILLGLLGIGHHYGLLGIRALKPSSDNRPQLAVIVVFLGLVCLHIIEIVMFAAVYRAILAWGTLGTLGADFGNSWLDLIYFSGINFVTLGYTQIETEGPLKLINMLQSLGGFMVLTWSATFLYANCEKAWKE
ncbi:hypothetical protein FF098_017420 [Parvularcula flava]|uniref:Potassium channel domain-containing protein n=1 Tax=Aquisalinus luteolus TaxID=1566827 RepID=A0A8J3EVY4_9PROT|nr:ion channel [Aquisalinus luteolus]NHK29690.1 hypothetical protein [Aquisalinus luteolus]GGI02097.1 hypothetical protein GCM10011355_34290 [Aquisalinus luteolus]